MQSLADGFKPTAVFAADDVTVFGVIQGLREMGHLSLRMSLLLVLTTTPCPVSLSLI